MIIMIIIDIIQNFCNASTPPYLQQMQDGRVIALPICPYIDTTTTTIHHEDRDNTHGHLHNYNHDKGHGDSHDGNCDVYHCQYPEGCRDDRVSDRDSDRGSDRDPSSITCTQEPRILPTKKSSNAAPDNGHAGMTHTITTSDSTNSALSSEGKGPQTEPNYNHITRSLELR